MHQLAAPGVRGDFPPLRSRTDRRWVVPDAMRTAYFTGRDALLDELRARLAERHRAALSGLGGVGKTQAALEYAARRRGDYPKGVFWVNAETEGSLYAGFVAIASALGLASASSSDHELAVRAAIAWLDANDGWLLVLDNVEDRRLVKRFLPDGELGQVLFTSREPTLPDLGVPRGLSVRDFGADESVAFLLARSGRDDATGAERAAAAELAEELGNLPLALEQAAAYVAETGGSFTAYLAAFRKRHLALLERSRELVVHETVSATWAANFEAVERESHATADLLRVTAFLAPDEIPFELFEKGADAFGPPIANTVADADDLSVLELLRPAARYSLIRFDAANRTYGIHRLVQEIIRGSIAPSEWQDYIERTIAAAAAAFPEVDVATWPECARLLPHARAALGSLPAGAAFLPAGRLAGQSAEYLRQRGDYASAERMARRGLEIREEALGPGHPDVAESLDALGRLHWYRGRFAEAEGFHVRALTIHERAFGLDHPAVARSLNGLALALDDQGRYAEAERLNTRALAIWERTLGPDCAQVGRTLNNLAATYTRQGRYADALPLQKRATAVWERAHGKEHPQAAFGLNNLAVIYQSLGQLAEAESFCLRSLAIRERVLGPEHPELPMSLNVLANVYADQKRYAEAEATHVRGLAIREKVFGPEHTDVAQSLNNLAAVYCLQERYAEAEPLLTRALAIREEARGPDNPEVAETLHNLASAYRGQGRAAEAEPLLARALPIREKVLGPDDPSTKETRDALDALRSTNRANR